MEWTAEDIAALKLAVKSGLLSVSYDGPPKRTIVYQSLAAMRDLLASMVADVATEAGTRVGYKFMSTKKGFDT